MSADRQESAASLDAALPNGLMLVGAGKMGGAMLVGWLRDGLSGSRVTIRDPNPGPEMQALASREGVRMNTGPGHPPSLLLLAVKPQMMDVVLPDIADDVGPGTLVVSVAAGKTIAALSAGVPAGTPIIRAMPNTPSAVGHGMTVMVGNAHVTETHRALVSRLMAAIGKTAWIDDEAHMDAVTGVSGSGPAYVFHMVEALAEAGVAAGLDADLAMTLARQTVAGAGALLDAAPETAATLRQNVTSPAGTTAAGLSVLMDDAALARLMRGTVAAAAQRSRELAE